MKDKKTQEFLAMMKDVYFPEGICCAKERCSHCAYLGDSDFYNDGKRHCSKLGRWVHPYDEACQYFTY